MGLYAQIWQPCSTPSRCPCWVPSSAPSWWCLRYAGFHQHHSQPGGRGSYALAPEYHPHLATLVSALIATYIFGLGTLAGTTAIAIFTFAYIGKILYEEIETVDMGPFEAMEAMGAAKVRSFISAIVPQVLPSYLSNCLFCFEGNVRYASILGYVAPAAWASSSTRRSAGASTTVWA